MRDLKEIYDEWAEIKNKLSTEQKMVLESILKETGLDKDVINIRTGKKGVLDIYKEHYSDNWDSIHFHHYTKNGFISKNQTGYISCSARTREKYKEILLEDFAPAESEEINEQ